VTQTVKCEFGNAFRDHSTVFTKGACTKKIAAAQWFTLSPIMRNTAPAKDVGEYLAGVPEPARSTLERVRAVIKANVPKDATETISYGIPMFKYNGMLLGFAAFKNHCSLFPTSMDVFTAFRQELKPFRASKGTLHFPLDQPFPTALLKKIVKMRVTQNSANAKAVTKVKKQGSRKSKKGARIKNKG
jgi:uncharacterized protein YdhG (YjbR/CyaY superfamily)